MKRRTLLFASAALAAAATARATAQPAATPLAVAPNVSTDQVIFYYAQSAGLFAKAGLDVTAVPSTSGSTSLLAVVGGAAQIGFTNTLSLAVAHGKGIPLVALTPGGIYDTNAPLAEILVAGDSPLKAPHDLAGKTIAVTGLHDLLALTTTAWLVKNGVDLSSVRFLEMPASSMLPALQGKRADAIALYHPYLLAAQSAGARVFGKPYDAIALEFEPGLWFASTPWANAHREAALRFSAAMKDSAAYVNAHFDDLLPLIASFTKLDVETLRKIPHPRFPPGVIAAQIQPVIDTAAKFKELQTAFPAQEMIFAGIAA